MAIFNGFSYADIKDHVITYIGNNSVEFAEYLDSLMLMAEHRYLKMHDWSFTYKTGLTLSIIKDKNEYDLNSTSIGYFMAATDVESIRSQTENVYLIKKDLAELRRLDAGMKYGSSLMPPIYWAAAGDNRIHFWPSTMKPGQLKIDGKITPALDLSGSPTIPMRYQEGFIEYVKALALDRENDDRAQSKKIEALSLIRQDIQDDMRNLGDAENPRIKSPFELPQASYTVTAEEGSTIMNAIHNVTGTYEVLESDYYIGVNTAGPVTLNLPLAALVGSAKVYIIKDETGQAATNAINIIPAAGNLIDGQASYVISIGYESITMVCDGTNWLIV